MTERSEAEAFRAVVAELGLTVEADFVPWSRSRNAGEKDPSLNWRVSVLREGRLVLATDFSAGCGHAPSYKDPSLGASNSVDRHEAIKQECETGFAWRGMGNFVKTRPLKPDPLDVLSSLAMDASVLDCATFEEWAADLGFDPDSRKGEAIYRTCLELALKLRAGLGDAGLAKLREAAAGW